MIDSVGLYVFLYILFALCIVFPPTEFISAGLTLDSLFSWLLGHEHLGFIEYHIRRTAFTAFAHSLLPFGFFIYLDIISEDVSIFSSLMDGPSLLWKCLFITSVLLPVGVASAIAHWYSGDWSNHPLVQLLRLYDRDWRQIASVIDAEFRRIDKFSIVLGGIRRVIVTDSWVMITGSYDVRLSHQADVRLTVVNTDEHEISHHSEAAVQFMNILVENISKPIPPFTLRLKSFDYRDLRAKLQAPIQEARDIIIHQSLDEQFVEAFVHYVQDNNPRHTMTTDMIRTLDSCMGCMMEQSNVKLEKRCIDVPNPGVDAEGQPIPHCRQCYCRPMWCLACMGRWWASRQDQRHPEVWLEGKSPCPTCRSTFCMLDISIVEPNT